MHPVILFTIVESSMCHHTYFSMKTIRPEVLGELVHAAGEAPEGVHLRVQHLQEATAQVVHPLGVADL